MISKELYEEVQKDYIDFKNITQDEYITIFNKEEETVEYVNKHTWYEADSISIYKLAHKCKEWAYTKYKIILTSKLFDYQIKNIFDCYLETGEKSRENIRNFAHPDFISNTEPEAIFKACQWILDNKI